MIFFSFRVPQDRLKGGPVFGAKGHTACRTVKLGKERRSERMNLKSLYGSLLAIFLSTSIALAYAQGEEPSPSIGLPPAEQFALSDTQGIVGRIAFAAKVDSREKIFVLDLAAKKISELIKEGGSNSSPAYSPDGSHIAFISSREGGSDIYIAEFDGQHAKQITKNGGSKESLTWSADGSAFIFSSKESPNGTSTNVFSAKKMTGTITQLTNFKGLNVTPELAPNGEVLAYTTDRFWPGHDICAYNLKDRTENCLLTGANTYARPRWSHSGKHLAYAFGAIEAADVGVFNLETATRSSVSALGKRETDIAWSPDDKTLIFSAETDKAGDYAIYLSDLTGRTSTLLRSPFPILSLTWSGTKNLELEARRIKEQEALSNPVSTATDKNAQ